MIWAEQLANKIMPEFGGFPTFVCDPDDLLEMPALREALRKRGAELYFWGGEPETLTCWSDVAPEQTPLIATPPDAPLYHINATLPEAVVRHVSLRMLFDNWDNALVRNVPSELWDRLLAVRDAWPQPPTPAAVASLIARVVYGVDPLQIRSLGWERAVAQVALTGAALPVRLIDNLPELKSAPDDVRQALGDAALARQWLRRHEPTDPLLELLQNAALRAASPFRRIPELVQAFEQHGLTGPQLSQLALVYGEACADGLSPEDRLACNMAFTSWLHRRYDLALTSHHPDVVPLHQLVERLIDEGADRRWLLIVVDALGLEAWQAVYAKWLSRGVLRSAHLRAGWAIVPTLTSWSRRALFEGVLPRHFGREMHSAVRERRFWEQRVPNGAAFNVKEPDAILDAMRQGKHICVLDVSWDQMGHAIDPAYQSLVEAASRWAERCDTASIVSMALDQGYRCIITSDHGQLVSQGIGTPPVGECAIERSRRCLIFQHKATRDHFSSFGDAAFQPITLPNGRHLLLARYGESFDAAGAMAVSHGGASIEELIVPIAEVTA